MKVIDSETLEFPHTLKCIAVIAYFFLSPALLCGSVFLAGLWVQTYLYPGLEAGIIFRGRGFVIAVFKVRSVQIILNIISLPQNCVSLSHFIVQNLELSNFSFLPSTLL